MAKYDTVTATKSRKPNCMIFSLKQNIRQDLFWKFSLQVCWQIWNLKLIESITFKSTNSSFHKKKKILRTMSPGLPMGNQPIQSSH